MLASTVTPPWVIPHSVEYGFGLIYWWYGDVLAIGTGCAFDGSPIGVGSFHGTIYSLLLDSTTHGTEDVSRRGDLT